MELHYFLADDTIEIVEKVAPNSGRDAVSMFLHRAKLPKEPLPVYQPGIKTKRTVLNVFGPTGHGGRYLYDSLKVSHKVKREMNFVSMLLLQTGAVNSEFYHDSDLVIGGVLNVWGRRLLICDCDKFTQEYYKSKYDVGKETKIYMTQMPHFNFNSDNFTPVDIPKPEARPVKREIPPYNGFGSREDSLATCMNLIPKPPRKSVLSTLTPPLSNASLSLSLPGTL